MGIAKIVLNEDLKHNTEELLKIRERVSEKIKFEKSTSLFAEKILDGYQFMKLKKVENKQINKY